MSSIGKTYLIDEEIHEFHRGDTDLCMYFVNLLRVHPALNKDVAFLNTFEEFVDIPHKGASCP
jgi:hypothetical protein